MDRLSWATRHNECDLERQSEKNAHTHTIEMQRSWVKMHRNIVAPTRYIDMTTAHILVNWSEACSNDSLPDHLLVSFVYISEYVGLWLFFLSVFFISIKSHNDVSSFAAVDLVLCSIFVLLVFLLLGESKWTSRNVCIFPLVIDVLRFIGCICKWYSWSVAMTENDNHITAVFTMPLWIW